MPINTSKEKSYKCLLCGTSRGIDKFMADTRLCATCLNSIGYPHHLPQVQWKQYIKTYIKKHNIKEL